MKKKIIVSIFMACGLLSACTTRKALVSTEISGETIMDNSDNGMDPSQIINDPNIDKLSEWEYYEYDLDGDKELEKVQYVAEMVEGEYGVKLSLYIDGENVYSNIIPYATSCQGYWLDLDNRDKKTNLLFEFTSDSDVLENIICLGYVNDSVEVVINDDNDTIGILRASVSKYQKENGTLTLNVEYNGGYLGQGFLAIPYKIEDRKLVNQKGSQAYFSEYWQLKGYTATIDIPLYDGVEQKNKTGTVREGEIFHVIMVDVQETPFQLLTERTPLVYIRTDEGKEGWIEVPDEEFFEEYEKYRWG